MNSRSQLTRNKGNTQSVFQTSNNSNDHKNQNLSESGHKNTFISKNGFEIMRILNHPNILKI